MRYDKFCLCGVRFLIREPGTENAVAGNQITDANKNANFNAFFTQTETLSVLLVVIQRRGSSTTWAWQ